jgi:hypothetical protein
VVLQKSFRKLRDVLQELQDLFEALSTTIEEDRPRRKDVVVASSLGDTVLAVRGLLEESCLAADAACTAVGAPGDLHQARRALITCQEQFHRFASDVARELASCERIADLSSVASERGRDWANWVKVVRQSLEQGQALIEDGREALFLCWQDLSERLGMTALSIRTTNIGQQLCSEKTHGAQSHDGRERSA